MMIYIKIMQTTFEQLELCNLKYHNFARTSKFFEKQFNMKF